MSLWSHPGQVEGQPPFGLHNHIRVGNAALCGFVPLAAELPGSDMGLLWLWGPPKDDRPNCGTCERMLPGAAQRLVEIIAAGALASQVVDHMLFGPQPTTGASPDETGLGVYQPPAPTPATADPMVWDKSEGEHGPVYTFEDEHRRCLVERDEDGRWEWFAWADGEFVGKGTASTSEDAMYAAEGAL